ncbi:MAG: hypothetical protein J1F02_07325 [Lachnospiraceae bacterium]|nr:hypothetical protein [Lachnospiraceae bacterium]
MQISGMGNSYNNVYERTNTSSKNEAAKKTGAETAEVQSKKSAGSKAADYYSYLAEKYDCVKNGNVAISGSYLRECANDPEKAKELEENLSLYKELRQRGYESAKQNAARLGGRLVSYSETWNIDSKGNVSMMASTTVVSENGSKSRKEIKEELEERLKKKKEEAKKAEKAEAQKEEQQEQLEKLQENTAAKEQIPREEYYPRLDIGI